jgi:hypothetical protein
VWKPKLSLNVTTQSTQNNMHLTNKDGQDEQDEECFFLEGMKEFLGDNSNSLKEVLGKGRRQTVKVV